VTVSSFGDSRVQRLIIVLGLPVLGQPALLQLLVLIPRCLQGCIASLVGAARMPERIAGAAR
jgi:hypothetical protein